VEPPSAATAVVDPSPAAAEPADPGAEGSSEARESQADVAPLLAHPIPTAIVTVAVAALAAAVYPTPARSALAAFFAAVLVVLSAVDLERRIIPNRIVLPATVIVLIAHIAIAPGRTLELILAPLAAALFLFLPNLLNASAVGMGDVKLALLLGVGLGWGVIGALLVGFLSTLPFAITMLVRGGAAARTKMMPLGPFLAFGGLVILIAPRL
jgi:leader peptidase (prepilin peptidase)/N-methyltransferase